MFIKAIDEVFSKLKTIILNRVFPSLGNSRLKKRRSGDKAMAENAN